LYVCPWSQAAGRAAASVPLAQANEEGESGSGSGSAGMAWSPNGHKVLEGASGLALASNGIAYVTGSDAGAVAAVNATDPLQPRVVREISDARLAGVTDLCAAGGDAGSAPGAGATPDGSGPAVVGLATVHHVLLQSKHQTMTPRVVSMQPISHTRE
jgi:hypothetical protein